MAQRLLRCLCLLVLLNGVLAGSARAQAPATQPNPPASHASVFIVGHQDDWQLFMGSRAYDNVQRHRKVVFIILTAGQGDYASDTWWKAREQGCLNSARTACDLKADQLPAPVYSKVTVRQHQLVASYYRNTVVYFLRLPDGGVRGQGYGVCNYQSLTKLRAGQGGPISSLDGRTQYRSWADLTNTVRDIIRRETRPSWTLWVNSPNPDEHANPVDHPDHLSAGHVADAATRDIPCRRLLYTGYSNARRPANLNAEQTANQTALFAAYCRTMTALGQPSGWQPDHLCWLGRQYSVMRRPATEQRVSAATAARLCNDSISDDPQMVLLAPPAPNPCTASSMLTYELVKSTAVNMSLYDLQGRLIKVLVEAEQVPGRYEVWLDVNQFPANGTYLCRLQAGKTISTQRVQIQR